MKRSLAILISAAMLITMFTGLTFTAGAEEITPAATLVSQPDGQSWTFGTNLTVKSSKVYTDHDMTYWDLGGLPLEGAAYLQTAMAYATESHDNSYNSAEIAATIQVNKSCDIYVLTTAAYTSYDGMKNSNYMRWLLPESMYAGNLAKYGEYEPVIANDAQVIVTTSSGRKLYAYKRHIKVAPGNTDEINLGNPGRWLGNNMYTVAIVWTEDALPMTMSTISPNTWKVSYPSVLGKSAYTDSTAALASYSNGAIHGIDYYGLTGENTVLIQSPEADNSAAPGCAVADGKQVSWTSLELSRSAEVYVLSPGTQDQDGNRYMNWLAERDFVHVTDSGADAQVRVGSFNMHLYKKSVYVPAGKTVTVTMGNVGRWMGHMYLAIVKFTDVAAPAAKTVTLSNNNKLNWNVINNTSITTSINPWYDSQNAFSTGLEAYDFSDVSQIKTLKYEPSNFASLYAGNAAGMVETLTVNHSCELYVFFPVEAASNCGKWLLDQGYKKCASNISGSPEFRVYKKAFPVPAGETLDIPVGGVNSNIMNQMCSFVVAWRDFPTLTLANTNNLNWEVVNNTSITGASSDKVYVNDGTEYYKTLNGYDFSDVSYIKSSGKYEPANEPYKTVHSGKTYQTIETMTVDHSCEVYILSPWTTHQNYFQWIDNYGYELQANQIVTSNNQAFNVYKRTYYLTDGETLDIPLGGANSSQVNKGYNVIVKWIDNPSAAPAKVSFTTISSHASDYVVTENAYVGERVVVNAARIIKNFNNSDLAGASVIKPFFSDINDINYTSADAATAEKKDYITLTINKSATVYIATNGKYLEGTYMYWLQDWQPAKDAQGSDMTINIQNDNGTYNKDWNLYKKTFKVADGETKTIILQNAYLYANEMYVPFVKFLSNETINKVTITADSGAEAHPGESTDILSGETIPMTIYPKEGYYIKSVKFNGVEVAGGVEGTVTYETPAINADSTVTIETDLLENFPLPDNLEYVSEVFSARGKQEPVVIEGKVYDMSVIAFATAKERIGAYERGEYGMLVSLDEPSSINDMLITNKNLIKAPAEGTNSEGQFGIRFYGDSITAGQKVWLRAFAEYDGTVIYGADIIEATF